MKPWSRKLAQALVMVTAMCIGASYTPWHRGTLKTLRLNECCLYNRKQCTLSDLNAPLRKESLLKQPALLRKLWPQQHCPHLAHPIGTNIHVSFHLPLAVWYWHWTVQRFLAKAAFRVCSLWMGGQLQETPHLEHKHTGDELNCFSELRLKGSPGRWCFYQAPSFPSFDIADLWLSHKCSRFGPEPSSSLSGALAKEGPGPGD